MAKKTKRPISKDGFVVYAKDIDACIEELSYEERGQLLTVVSQFVNGRELESHPRVVKMAFNIIKKGILANEEKYSKRQETLKAYYDKKNAENEKNAEIVKNLLGNGNSDGNGIGIGNGNGNGIGNGNGDGNGENNTNSLSEKETNKIKYTFQEVKAILEEREIFLKENYLRDFYHLNNDIFHWKYDPYNAFCAWINNPLHKDALKESGKKKENAPQFSAPPPNVQQDIQAHFIKEGERLWKELYKELSEKLPPDILAIADRKIGVLAARLGYNDYEMRLDFYDVDADDVQHRLDTCAEFQDSLKAHRVKRLRYGLRPRDKAA